MLKATAGVRGIVPRLRAVLRDRRQKKAAAAHAAGSIAEPSSHPAGTLRRRLAGHIRSVGSVTRGAARRVVAPFMDLVALPLRGLPIRAALARLVESERILPVGIVVLILVSAMYSFSPLGGSAQAVPPGGQESAAPRIAIGGGAAIRSGAVLGVADLSSRSTDGNLGAMQDGGMDSDLSADRTGFLDDGTLQKPVVVDTTVSDGSNLLLDYTVQSGDTLVGIANKFGVSMMTVWWANELPTTYELKVGQHLVVPALDGVVIKVQEGDTIEDLSGQYSVDPGQIISVNGLEDPNLVIGQTLLLPGARGDAVPPKARTPTPPPRTMSSGSVRTPTTYSGGSFAWPVVGGGNYISQYFRYGHYGVDIAASYGTKVVAAARGTVIFSGWKNNGGGYQVWIAHGSGLYTTYNHMSALTVSSGQSVGRGQQVGRIGMTGYATGPHLHFEVWVGPIWSGGYRVNPLRYY